METLPHLSFRRKNERICHGAFVELVIFDPDVARGVVLNNARVPLTLYCRGGDGLFVKLHSGDGPEYSSDDNPEAAQHLKDEIEAKASKLLEYPKLYKPGRVSGMREIMSNEPFLHASSRLTQT